ncbi:MAG: hypothetical protein WC546_06570 [Candidatus Omnitrophota bacterium]
MKYFVCCLFLASFFIPSAFPQAPETISLTTYYPSPAGVYTELRTEREAIGDNYMQSSYCWGAGCGANVITAGTSLVVEGRTSIGTAMPEPWALLDVHTRPITTGQNNALHVWNPTEGGLLIGYLGPYIQARDTIDGNTANLILNNWGGNVGVGTNATPRAKLDVQGEVKVGNTSLACNENAYGSLRYNNNAIEYCSPSGWRAAGGSPVLAYENVYHPNANPAEKTYAITRTFNIQENGIVNIAAMGTSKCNCSGGVNTGIWLSIQLDGSGCSKAESFEGEMYVASNMMTSASCIAPVNAGSHTITVTSAAFSAGSWVEETKLDYMVLRR